MAMRFIIGQTRSKDLGEKIHNFWTFKNIFKQLKTNVKSTNSLKILIMIQKNKFNSEYEREKYLKFFGESPIFFGSILNLI